MLNFYHQGEKVVSLLYAASYGDVTALRRWCWWLRVLYLVMIMMILLRWYTISTYYMNSHLPISWSLQLGTRHYTYNIHFVILIYFIFFLYSLLLFVNPYFLCSIYLWAITLSSLWQSYWLKLHDFVACHILWICQIILFFMTGFWYFKLQHKK